jgi:hypothetical protein
VTQKPEDESARTLPLSHHIYWSELLRRLFAIDTICPGCKTPLRLIALIKTDDTITTSPGFSDARKTTSK